MVSRPAQANSLQDAISKITRAKWSEREREKKGKEGGSINTQL
jgi:hypothetical protein